MCTLLYDVQYAMYNTMYIVYRYMCCTMSTHTNTYMYCTLEWVKPQSLSYTHVM